MPLSLPVLSATAHARQFVNRRGHAQLFPAGPGRAHDSRSPARQWRGEIDALALRKGGGKFERIKPYKRQIPADPQQPERKTPTPRCAVRWSASRSRRATGVLRIAKAYSVLECGKALVPEIVLGQNAGRLRDGGRLRPARNAAALRRRARQRPMEPRPITWSRRGSDLPLRDLEIEMLPPLTADEPPKGMGEVVMIPVVPAILNAIFDATGRRFQSLPVTSAMLKEALA